jgi:hypothetical protein
MKGLTAQGTQAEEQVPAEEPAEQEQAVASGEEVTPEAQENYERVVMAASEVLHSDETHDSIMGMLKSGADDPGATMAEITTMVMLQLDEQSGGKIPEDVILPASEEVLTMVAELAHAAQIFTPDQQALNSAMQQTVTKLGEHYGVSPEDIQELLSQMDPAEVERIVAEQQGYSKPAEQPAGAQQ